MESAGFVVSLEMRRSSVTDLADVVFPVAAVAEKSGAFLDWEGRVREFGIALRGTDTLPDQRVLDALAAEMGTRLGVPDAESARRELDLLGPWEGQRPADPATLGPTSSSSSLSRASLIVRSLSKGSKAPRTARLSASLRALIRAARILSMDRDRLLPKRFAISSASLLRASRSSGVFSASWASCRR